MGYFSYTQKIWSILVIMTVIFASVTVDTVSYSWFTIAFMFGLVLICGMLNQLRLGEKISCSVTRKLSFTTQSIKHGSLKPKVIEILNNNKKN